MARQFLDALSFGLGTHWIPKWNLSLISWNEVQYNVNEEDKLLALVFHISKVSLNIDWIETKFKITFDRKMIFVLSFHTFVFVSSLLLSSMTDTCKQILIVHQNRSKPVKTGSCRKKRDANFASHDVTRRCLTLKKSRVRRSTFFRLGSERRRRRNERHARRHVVHHHRRRHRCRLWTPPTKIWEKKIRTLGGERQNYWR